MCDCRESGHATNEDDTGPVRCGDCECHSPDDEATRTPRDTKLRSSDGRTWCRIARGCDDASVVRRVVVRVTRGGCGGDTRLHQPSVAWPVDVVTVVGGVCVVGLPAHRPHIGVAGPLASPRLVASIRFACVWLVMESSRLISSALAKRTSELRMVGRLCSRNTKFRRSGKREGEKDDRDSK
jgi:hypothetical protein